MTEAILPARRGEPDDERRLREALERHLGAALSTLDCALALRKAPGSAKRMRQLFRNNLIEAGHKGLHAYHLLNEEKADDDAT